MAHIETVQPDQASGVLKQIYDAAIARVGYVANIISVMSRHAPTAQASMQMYARTMKADGPLPKRQREMLAALVSHLNDCHY